jgi:hypothetical protein
MRATTSTTACLAACLTVLCGGFAHGAEAAERAVTLGVEAEATGGAGVAIGAGARAERGAGVAVGPDAVATGQEEIAKGQGLETLAIGPKARAEGWRCTAVGAGAVAKVVSATALGRATYASGAHMIAIGRGAYLERMKGSPELDFANGCGIAGDSLWLGGMACHKIVDKTGDTYVHEKADGGDGTARWDVRTFKPTTYTIHGADAYDARFDQFPERFRRDAHDANDPATWIHREDKDVAGGSLHIAAGRGTGTAAGGAIELQTAPAGKESRNRKNPLQTAVRIDTDYAAENGTPMLLWDNQARKLKRVMVGPPDSGGKGFRALVVEN